jgi:hypothetical protein
MVDVTAYNYSKSAIHPEWYTPYDLLTRIQSFMGGSGAYLYDRATSPEAVRMSGVTPWDMITTKEGDLVWDALQQKYVSDDPGFDEMFDTRPSVFLNPPGSRADGKLKYRMFGDLIEGVNVKRYCEGILLVYSVNSISKYLEVATKSGSDNRLVVLHLRNRINFVPSPDNPASSKPSSSPLSDNALVYYGDRSGTFINKFRDLGTALRGVTSGSQQ